MPRKLTATTGVVLALALVGCGSDNSSKTTSQSAAATTPVVTTPATTTSAGKASKSKSTSKKTTTTSKKTDAATTSGSKKKPPGIGTETKKPVTTKKPAAKKTTTTSKKPVGVTPATGSGSTGDTSNGTGSGPTADRLAIVAVLRRYYKAFIESNGADACAQLTSEGQSILKQEGGGKSCAEAVPALVKKAGADNVNRLSSTRDGLHVNDVTVTGNNATAEIGAQSRLRLVQVNGRWYLRSPNVVNGNG